MGQFFKLSWCALPFSACLLMCLASDGVWASKRVLTLGVWNHPPFYTELDAAQPGGINIEIMQLVTELLGWRLETKTGSFKPRINLTR